MTYENCVNVCHYDGRNRMDICDLHQLQILFKLNMEHVSLYNQIENRFCPPIAKNI